MAEAIAETANQGGVTTTVIQQEHHQQEHEVASSADSSQGNAGPGVSQTLVLRLRPRPSVTWGADVINNEGMGKKSSKREYNESRCVLARKRVSLDFVCVSLN